MTVAEYENRLAMLEERMNGIEARVERLEKLYGIYADDTHFDLGEFIKTRLRMAQVEQTGE